MVRLTAELIITSPAFVNPLKERELDLRGNKIAQIENLGATEDQYDVLDFSDNDVTRLDGFPLLVRLSTVLISNNRVSSIAYGLGSKIANLETLILSNNRIENLLDLDPLMEFKHLHNLSLLRNPVTKVKNYRLYLVYLLPSLRVLDFNKVKKKEKIEAKKLFENTEVAVKVTNFLKTGTILSTNSSISNKDTGRTTDGTSTQKPETTVPMRPSQPTSLSDEQKQKLEQLIKQATTTEEVQKLERILRTGKIPKAYEKVLGGAGGGAEQALEEGLDMERDDRQRLNNSST